MAEEAVPVAGSGAGEAAETVLSAQNPPLPSGGRPPQTPPLQTSRGPLLPGFREMALRRMAAQRRRLVMDLAAERQAARLSQTEVAARMGTSQSAVARLESGEADARASTLERYAAAIGHQITWQLQVPVSSSRGPSRREEASADGYAR